MNKEVSTIPTKEPLVIWKTRSGVLYQTMDGLTIERFGLSKRTAHEKFKITDPPGYAADDMLYFAQLIEQQRESLHLVDFDVKLHSSFEGRDGWSKHEPPMYGSGPAFELVADTDGIDLYFKQEDCDMALWAHLPVRFMTRRGAVRFIESLPTNMDINTAVAEYGFTDSGAV